jgi:hypothetical protein
MIDYQLEFKLENGTHLKIVNHDSKIQKWFYSYRMIHPEAQIRTEKPDLVNDNELIVEYYNKKIVSMKLNMDIKNPKNSGKVVVAGLDISPNSHLFLEFEYQKDSQGTFIMNKVFKNAQLVVDFNKILII